ncbi:MAG: 2-dehydro-3-deoxygluconokinase [Kosmotogales bacterium]|nr:2-dehydro-3-deoxygluconokinase [Kosmotogales bacterium]
MAKVVSFGETMIRLSTIRQERIEQSQYLEFRSAGAESNFCLGCTRMGVETVWVSKLTNNALGKSIVNNLNRYGVNTSIVWTNKYRVGTYYIEYGAFPRNTQVIYDRNGSAVRYIESSEIDWKVLENADLIHLTGITLALGENTKAVMMDFIEEAKKRNIKLSFDVNYRSKLWSPERACKEISQVLKLGFDYLFVSLKDAETLFKVKGTNKEIVTWLKGKFKSNLVVLTLGAKGAMAFDGDKIYEESTKTSDTVDPIGSGDAFDAGFVSSLMKGNNIEKSLKIGNSLAALKRTIIGDEPIFNYEEVLNITNINNKGIER